MSSASACPPEIDAASTVILTGPSPVNGTLSVPGDKSISHRALLLSGLSTGETVVEGLSAGEDVRCTRQALSGFGVELTETPGGLVVRGGLRHEPEEPLDHGNSGTGIRLMSGVCAGQEMFTVLTGDRYLRLRPMDRVARPLRAMGALIDGRRGGSFAPLAIRGGELTGIRFESPIASAQVKSAVLLAGILASGQTTVVEPTITRRHTEEMLADFGAEVTVEGTSVSVRRSTLTSPGRVSVPGDPSQAAFWLVAGLVADASSVLTENLYLGLGRGGFLTTLTRMGAELDIDRTSGTVEARTSRLRGITITAADIVDMIDEIPIVAVAAATAQGTTVISGAAELRVKESDRIKSTVAMLTAFGAQAQETTDGMVIEGGRPLHGGTVDSHGDHRIAMASAVCALAAAGETVIHGWDSVRTSYPGFAADLQRLTGERTRLTMVE
ncbi:MAG: 3-phosphoshikimate 1-carboxyvinyltransferase [Pseudonocardiaceae bacterium]